MVSGEPEEVMGRLARTYATRADAIRDGVRRGLRRDGERWKAAMISSISGPLYRDLFVDGPKPRGEKLATRRGNAGLRGGFYYNVLDGPNGWEIHKGNSRRHSTVHELGTVGAGGTLPDIVPKNGRYLAIPLGAALTPGGVPRAPGPRSYPDGFFFETSKGLFFVQSKGGGDLEFLYLMSKRSRIPPRLGQKKTHLAQAPKRQEDILGEIRKALEAVKA